MKWLTKWMMVAALVLSASLMLTAFAQDATPVAVEGNLTIVTGAVSFAADGSIVVAGVTIAPAGGFNPSTLQTGDIVIVTGVLLPSGTLQAISLELFDDEPEQPEVTPEATAEMTPEATAEFTPEPTAEVTPEATPEATAEPTAAPTCGNPNHPVAQSIAATFGVSYEEVMALHCAGNGFGEIVRAYTLAELSEGGTTAEDLLERHKNGEGWGKIIRESGVHPAELAPGRVLKRTNDAEPTPEASSGGGNGGGNGNGNGNGGGNGRGNGTGG